MTAILRGVLFFILLNIPTLSIPKRVIERVVYYRYSIGSKRELLEEAVRENRRHKKGVIVGGGKWSLAFWHSGIVSRCAIVPFLYFPF